jgi:D-lactate dehydrogenase
VIGSSCIGASVIGGICNNSGGSLVQRGPAYTEMSLFAQIDENGKLKLVNHLGIDLGSTPEQILSRLDDERISDSDVLHDGRHAHDHDYVTRVRDVDADTPARYNADPDRLFESSGCAGKLAVFAVRLDTFPAEKRQQVFYIGTNQPQVLTEIRRHILAEFQHLPVAGNICTAIFTISPSVRQRHLPDDRQARHRQNAVLLHHEGPHRRDAGESVAV